MTEIPDYIQRARERWEYRGQRRPDFAIVPNEEQESVWDYPRPPRIEKDSRTVVVKHQNIIVAETNNAMRVLETASPPTIYIPLEDVTINFLVKASGSSLCEWKGNATYWDVKLPQKTFKKVGWSYQKPFDEFITIAGYLSFYPAILDCFINEERVQPQPGGLY